VRFFRALVRSTLASHQFMRGLVELSSVGMPERLATARQQLMFVCSAREGRRGSLGQIAGEECQDRELAALFKSLRASRHCFYLRWPLKQGSDHPVKVCRD
jgi:hypothetical protein